MHLSAYRGGLPFGPASMPTNGPLGYALGQSDAGRNLQNALNVLASIVNDPQMVVKVDGVIGKNTAAAYNRAAKRYLSMPPPKGRTGKLSLAIVKKYAPRFTGFIRGEIELRQKQGGPQATAPAPTPDAPKGKKAPPAKTAAATTLQAAIRSLGKRTNDSTLLIKVDGLVGPKTRAATNRALTRYATEAPADLRTGKLTADQIRQKAAQIAVAIEQAARDAKPTPQAAPEAQKPVVSKADVRRLQTNLRKLGELTNDAVLKIAVDGIVGPRTTAAASKAVGRKLTSSSVRLNAATLANDVEQVIVQKQSAPGPKPSAAPAPVPTTTPRIAVARLQRALADLGTLLGDPVLKIRSDGIAGPKTAAALNRAMQVYVKEKPASMSQTLAPAQIAVMAEALATQLESELAQRRADLIKKTPEATTKPEARAEREAPMPQPQPQPTPRTTPSAAYEDQAPTPAPDEKATPWGWIIGGGVALLVVGGLTVAAFSKRSRRALAPA